MKTNSTTSPKLGFVAIARITFDIPLATEITHQIWEQLQDDFTLMGSKELVTNDEEAQAVIHDLQAQEPDALLVVQATFADSTMLLDIMQSLELPVLLWAVHEAHTGGRLRLNSLCGINLGGHALTRRSIPYEYVYAQPNDEQALEKITQFARAARVKSMLADTRLGRVGEHPAGFDTCELDADVIQRRFGIEVVQMDLQEQVFEPAKQVTETAIQAVRSSLTDRVNGLETVGTAATNGTLSVFHTLNQYADEHDIDGFAVRCWPEFFTELGCAACGAMSMLSDAMKPCSCEADVNGTITQLILQGLSGEPAFGTDIVSVDTDQDALVVWHCGLAPLSMADPESEAGVTIHSNRKLPLLMEFPLKPGTVTIARLSEATGNYRLVIGRAEVVRGEKAFSGTSGRIRFERPANNVLDTILREGLEHHISLTYGDYSAELMLLASMLGLETLHL